MDLIWQFEFKDSAGHTCFCRVIDKFEHHYTKAPMYYVRIDWVGPVTGAGHVQFKVVDQDKFSEMFAARITGNDT